jgi:pyruvate,water dikinase
LPDPACKLIQLEEGIDRDEVGGKAWRLSWLISQQVPVPRTMVLPFSLRQDFEKQEGEIWEQIRADLMAQLDPEKSYAIRSSANLEDGKTHSFAGQFTSHLEVQGINQVIQKAREVYRSANNPNLKAYISQSENSLDSLKMAVIIQEMVDPVVSGVSFSVNPLTGLDEVVIEAVEGRGDRLHQGGVTPDRWVNKWGKWTRQPEELHIDPDTISTVVSLTRQLADAFGRPIDLEWVYDGETIYWVQVREITGFGRVNIYSNRISREVLPGIIKPLVWSINVPLVNSAWIDLFTELIGPNDIDPDQLSKAFHYRAYFNMGTIGRIFNALGFPEESLEILMGMEGGNDKPAFRPSWTTLQHLPRMIRFLLDKLSFTRKVREHLPQSEARFQAMAEVDIGRLDDNSILEQVEQLFAVTREAAYFNIVTPLLMGVYNSLLRALLTRRGVDFARLDMTSGVEGYERFDPLPQLARLNARFTTLEDQIQIQVLEGDFAQFTKIPGIADFQNGVQGFLAQFGHFSDSGNDFSHPTWRENHDFVLQMITQFMPPARVGEKLDWRSLPLSWLDRRLLTPLFRKAREFRFLREAVSFGYTYGYGLFRKFYLELGRRFASRAWLDQVDDIFFLYRDEVRGMACETVDISAMNETISARRKAVEASQHIELPEIIFGDNPPPPESEDVESQGLTGIPTSPGYYRGPARVILRVTEMDQLVPGDVLVIPYSDVSWTPLFARAGAVIAESGGILSHSSIVAREYGIPCVVSVSNACRIPEGSEVTVDGFHGQILLHPPS